MLQELVHRAALVIHKARQIILDFGQDIGRITLSRRVLEGAMSKHLVIFGDEKRVAVERAQSLPALEAPIGAVLNEATVHWAP